MTPRTLLRRTSVAAALCIAALLAAPATGQESDADQRYHEAYVLEVVDGRIADAAKEYLAIERDAAAPAHIRAEARFRFAVCAVLLGRADEGRSRLADLAGDPDAPEAVRSRARDYLESIRNVGVGRELDRKLEELLFALGRVSPEEPAPEPYRDFEILGDAARPFLRDLLDHSDRQIGQHAFRLLVRMDEPGMGGRWTPRSGQLDTGSRRSEFAAYLNSRPEELAALLDRFRELPDTELNPVGMMVRVVYPLEFIREIEGRSRDWSVIYRLALNAGEHQDRLFAEWVAAEDPELASACARSLCTSAAQGSESALREGVKPGVLAATAVALARSGRRFEYKGDDPKRNVSEVTGLQRLAEAARPAEVLGAIESLVALLPGLDERTPTVLSFSLGDALAAGLDARGRDGSDPDRYLASLRAWLSAQDQRLETLQGGSSQWDPGPYMADHVRCVLTALPLEVAVPQAVEWLERAEASSFAAGIPFEREGWADAFSARLDALPGHERSSVLHKAVVPDRQARTSPALADILTRTIPGLVRDANELVSASIWDAYRALSVRLDSAVAQERLVAAWSATTGLQGAARNGVVHGLVFKGGLPTEYGLGVVLPSLDRLWAGNEDPQVRKDLLEWVAKGVVEARRTGALDGSAWTLLERFLSSHIDEWSDLASMTVWRVLAREPGLVPTESWVRSVPAAVWTDQALRTEWRSREIDHDAFARELVADPETLREGAVSFVVNMAGPEAKQEILDRLTANADPSTLRTIVRGCAGGRPTDSVAILERMVDGLLAAPDPDASALATAVRWELEVRSSERLVPAVRWFLGQSDAAEDGAGLAGLGIEWARTLGTPDLIPDLARLLRSTVPGVRDAAQAAIQAIRELEALRADADRDPGGRVPR